jgi:NAD(P)-dependent dehydrogenase (short-subunit alcohol dehydrogenase family)
MAGHTILPLELTEQADKLLDQPHDINFISAMEAITKGNSGLSYTISKRGVIRMVEKQGVAWGKKGARIVSVSPGLINTPMGKKEAAAVTGARLKQLNPLGRFGEPDEIAAPIEFLCSTGASYINGCDIRIDGGVTPILQGKVAPE